MAGIHEFRFPKYYIPRLTLTALNAVFIITALILLGTIVSSETLNVPIVLSLVFYGLNLSGFLIWLFCVQWQKLFTVGALRHFIFYGFCMVLTMANIIVLVVAIAGSSICNFAPHSSCAYSRFLLGIDIVILMFSSVCAYLSFREVVMLNFKYRSLHGHSDELNYELLARDRTALSNLGFISAENARGTMPHDDGLTRGPVRSQSRRFARSTRKKSLRSITVAQRDPKNQVFKVEMNPPRYPPKARHIPPSPYMPNLQNPTSRGTTTLGKAADWYF